MPAGSVPCPDCGQPVPGDRVSCPNCGALLSDAAPSPAGDAIPSAAGEAPGVSDDDLRPVGDSSAMDVGAGAVVPAGAPTGSGAETDIPAPPASPVPGAYMPPSSVHRPVPISPPAQMPLAASPAVGAPPPAPTLGWSPPTPVAPPTPPSPAPAQSGRASLFADLPFDAPDSMAEWLVAIGSSVAAVSFLLPWISGTTSYVTSWGLGSMSRLPILVLLVITAVLAILPNRVALWVRAGVLALIGGALFFGNLWPIVAGDFGDAAFGAIAGAAAAIVLVIGGILGVAPRGATPDAG